MPKENFLGHGGGITGTHSRKQGPEREIDGRETRIMWRLTGIQTVVDSVLAGAKKSAAKAKTPCDWSQKVCDWRQNRQRFLSRHKVTVKTDGVSMLGAHMYVRLARVIEINHVVIGVLIRLHVNLYARLVLLRLRHLHAFDFCHEVQSLRG